MVMVREATDEDWQAVRDARLAALREAPDAFASTAEDEAAYSEQDWRAWTQVGGRGVLYLAGVAGVPEPAGIAGTLAVDGEAHLISMWVHPAGRGQKVGQELIEAAAGWARSRGFDTLYLWVTESNGPARQLYERCGFTLTGQRQPLPSNPALPEIKMSRPL
ncbi:MAG TPA: GNAT family N-acetyltransferase [Trebonia sp.]|nr:GNAT family N-acetyltransferase [Trebonia sp.]